MDSYQQMGLTRYKNESVATMTCTYTIGALLLQDYIRYRPFNLQGEGEEGYGFLFRSEKFFRTTRELEFFFFFFYCAKREIFFQNLTLIYMRKTLNQIIFFPPPKSEYFFQQHWESEYSFRKKPYPTFKLNGRSIRAITGKVIWRGDEMHFM